MKTNLNPKRKQNLKERRNHIQIKKERKNYILNNKKMKKNKIKR